MYDNSTGAGLGAAIVVMVVWIVIALGLLVWYLWAMAVSYTHLDVYKRQPIACPRHSSTAS